MEPENRFSKIEGDVVNLNWYWKYLNEIFIGNDPSDRRDLLQATSPIFFSMCRPAFYDQVLLIIARLCDPASSLVGKGKLENLSIQNLIEQLKPFSAESKLPQEIVKFEQIVKAHYDQTVKIVRHKKIAHADLNVRMGIEILSPPKKDDLVRLINGINELCSAISSEYKGTSIDFAPYSTITSESEHFFNILRAGINAQRENE